MRGADAGSIAMAAAAVLRAKVGAEALPCCDEEASSCSFLHGAVAEATLLQTGGGDIDHRGVVTASPLLQPKEVTSTISTARMVIAVSLLQLEVSSTRGMPAAELLRCR